MRQSMLAAKRFLQARPCNIKRFAKLWPKVFKEASEQLWNATLKRLRRSNAAQCRFSRLLLSEGSLGFGSKDNGCLAESFVSACPLAAAGRAHGAPTLGQLEHRVLEMCSGSSPY